MKSVERVTYSLTTGVEELEVYQELSLDLG
jgi:hypothetical protein